MTPLESRFKQLILRQELHIGNLNSADIGVVLISATIAIPNRQALTEKDVTQRLQAWLSTVGSNVQADAVELRRHLVDFHLLERDRAGREYRRVTEWPAKWRDIGGELETLDAELFAERVRADEAQERAARKKAALEARGGLTS